jgi:hypothetical protein
LQPHLLAREDPDVRGAARLVDRALQELRHLLCRAGVEHPRVDADVGRWRIADILKHQLELDHRRIFGRGRAGGDELHLDLGARPGRLGRRSRYRGNLGGSFSAGLATGLGAGGARSASGSGGATSSASAFVSFAPSVRRRRMTRKAIIASPAGMASHSQFQPPSG